MTRAVDTPMPMEACERAVVGLRRRLGELEAWTDGSIKALAQAAVRDEMARVGREMVALEWRWA